MCRVFASSLSMIHRVEARTSLGTSRARSMIHYSLITHGLQFQSGGGQRRIHCKFSISICHTQHRGRERGISIPPNISSWRAPRPAAGNADLNKTTRGSDHIQCPSTQILRAHIFIASCASSFSELAAQLAGGGARRRGTILSTASLSSMILLAEVTTSNAPVHIL